MIHKVIGYTLLALPFLAIVGLLWYINGLKDVCIVLGAVGVIAACMIGGAYLVS